MWWWIGGGWIAFIGAFLVLGSLRARQRERWAEMHRQSLSKYAFGPWRWSQDGYVRVCKLTGVTQYGGDDYNGGPDDEGCVVPPR